MFTEMKGWPAALGDAVDGLGDEALARPVLARDEDVGVRGPHPRDEVQDRPHRGGLRDEGEALLSAQELVFLLQPAVGPDGPRELDLVAHDREQPEILPRLGHEIPRAPAHRLDGELHVRPCRHDDDRQRRIDRLQPAQEVQPLLSACRVPCVVEVDQRQGVVARLHGLHRGRGRFHGLDLVALVLQQEPKGLDDVGMVVSDQDAMGRRAGHGFIQGSGRRGDERQKLTRRRA
jgi:hypothetical protein